MNLLVDDAAELPELGGNPMLDEEIAVVRRVRHEISEECGHDVHRAAKYYRTVGKQIRLSGEFLPDIHPKERVSLADSARLKSS